MSGVIHEIAPPDSQESNGILEYFSQTIDTIARSMLIAAPDFLCLWVEAITMGSYLKNRLLHKYLLSSTRHLECFNGNSPIISHLNPLKSKSDGQI
jgi:hypothetical protein